MAFEIRVNGKLFTLWETAELSRSIDVNAGTFQFTSSNVVPSDYPVRAGDRVQVVINGVPKLTGFAESITIENAIDNHSISVEGRDNTCDLIDSSVPDAVKMIEPPFDLRELCQRVIQTLGANIPVINSVGSDVLFSGEEAEFDDPDVEDGQSGSDSGRKCMDMLVSFARKKQIYLVTNGQGGLLIYRPGSVRSATKLLNERNGSNNNIKKATANFRHQDRFHTYRITSQDNFSRGDYEDESVERNSQAIDSEIRSSRYLEFQAEESMANADLVRRVIEEINLRKAQSIEYTAMLQGVTQENMELWDFGMLVSLKDDFVDMRGLFLIRAVEYRVSLQDGIEVQLTLTIPEGYNVKVPNEKDSRRARQAPRLQRQTPAKTNKPLR